MPSSSDIRKQFIDYFVQKRGHTFVASSPVVPHDDPTLLFTNAGMNQFKDTFLGTGSREYTRAANSQKCIRAGGKHNDLEDVGRDTYHHTFFEMLGNWSFGDYFKAEAIAWAWELLTDVWGLEKDRLHVTVFAGDAGDGLEADTEAADLWKSLTDIDHGHIHLGDKKDNFWEMGDTGPCGPCSEVHIDLTPDKSGHALINADDARMIEIWNLVFIQYNRDSGGRLSPLPAKHVDTGMGFERVCAVLQGKSSNYDSDVFTPIFDAIREVTGAAAYAGRDDDAKDIAYRVIADHARCLTVALTDGATPSNEGRGYVLRRILRRAARHGRQTLGVTEPFLHKLVPAVVSVMGEAFPELTKSPQRVIDLIRDEEESFGRTLDRGIELFHDAAGRGGGRVSAQDAFKLHDTYGFPLDLTQVMADERGMEVDVAGFNTLMAEAREQARSGGGGSDSTAELAQAIGHDSPPATVFTGYDEIETRVKTFCLIYKQGENTYNRAASAKPGDAAALVLGKSPFYAAAGGQVGDQGTIKNEQGGVFRVTDTLKAAGVIIHVGEVEAGEFGEASVSTQEAAFTLRVDAGRRDAIMRNHTGTHMLNRALREVLGDHVQQKGSLVDDQKLRFDLSHDSVITAEQINEIEQLVNGDIASDLPVYAEEAPQEDAIKIHGLRAVFGEKYPPRVRVVSIGAPVDDLLAEPENADWRRYSIEFCGGTHLTKTGDAEGFVVIGEEAVAKGVRRIVGMTGPAAHRVAAQGERLVARLDSLGGAGVEQLAGAVTELADAVAEQELPLLAAAKLRDGLATLRKKLKQHDKEHSKASAHTVVAAARELAEQADGELIVSEVAGADPSTLRTAMDVVRKKHPDAAVLLGAVSGDKVGFVAAVPKALIDKGLKAGDWVREVAKAAGGGGGGRPDMAQAGGKDPAKLGEALEVARSFASSKLSATGCTPS